MRKGRLKSNDEGVILRGLLPGEVVHVCRPGSRTCPTRKMADAAALQRCASPSVYCKKHVVPRTGIDGEGFLERLFIRAVEFSISKCFGPSSVAKG